MIFCSNTTILLRFTKQWRNVIFFTSFTGREPIGDLFRVKPWYLLLGGAIGAFITITVIWSMAGLGPAKAAMLIVISQLAAAWLIELFGLFGMEKTDFTVRKLLGMAVAVVGIVVFQWE